MPLSPRRKIAHLTTVDLSLRLLLLAQLEAAVAAGDEVIGISAPGPDVAFLEERGIRHVPLPASTRSRSVIADLRAAAQLWRALRAERPDVLHTHNPKPGVYGRIVGRLAGVPLVVHTTHGLYALPDDRLLKRLVVYGLEAIAGRFSDVELVQNEEDLEVMARLRLVPRRKLVLLGNGVDLDRFDGLRPHPRDALREEWGIAPHEIAVGLLARLVVEKGIPELVDAVTSLGAPFRLVLVGGHDPSKPGAIPSAAIDAARRRGVVVTGRRDDVEACYAALDIFCLPSHREGFPRAAMEAAAMGLPVVATDIRGCRQVVDDGETGLLVPVRRADALAAALRTLADPARRAEMGAKARTLAERSFDERDVVATVLAAHDLRRGERLESRRARPHG